MEKLFEYLFRIQETNGLIRKAISIPIKKGDMADKKALRVAEVDSQKKTARTKTAIINTDTMQ